ncbi:MFS transporter [Algimonas arctica]|uniref:MFS transporter n=1 Tax=Algimonas arctica TaxID=1479486 RepID=A0A8J3CKM2_9PROT|nr:MFS transporter [Algimonas arctica]GHA82653.1 MFS transporter [Algimonas arctica]
MAVTETLETIIYRLAIDDDGRSCKDIPDSACNEEPGNFQRHVLALSLTKISDGLIDPKLILSWLMTQLGAGSGLVGLLVPIREAGALLPQLFTAAWLRRLPQRKWAWSLGAIIQGLMAIAIVAAALFAPKTMAPALILIALTTLSLARSVCSVCYKDVLGKTVSKSHRGAATGLASSIAGGGTMAFAALLILGWVDRYTQFIGAITLAGIAWLLSAAIFATLSEDKGATSGGGSAIKDAVSNLSYLKTDPQLRLFIVVRALLTATALAPPFIVASAGKSSGSLLETLGFFVLASATASLVSGFVWGRLSDRSSRKVLIATGIVAAGILSLTALVIVSGRTENLHLLPFCLFILMLAYEGVRLGRSTHLVDMADADTRAAYTALSNTVIGIVLLAGSGFGLIAHLLGPATTIATMATMSAAAAGLALKLDEVQAD